MGDETAEQLEEPTEGLTLSFPVDADYVFGADAYSITPATDGVDLLFGLAAPDGKVYELLHLRLLGVGLLTSAQTGREGFSATLEQYRVGTSPVRDFRDDLSREDVGIESHLVNATQFAVTLFGGAATFLFLDPVDLVQAGTRGTAVGEPVVRVVFPPSVFARFYDDLMAAADVLLGGIAEDYPYLAPAAGEMFVPLHQGTAERGDE